MYNQNNPSLIHNPLDSHKTSISSRTINQTNIRNSLESLNTQESSNTLNSSNSKEILNSRNLADSKNPSNLLHYEAHIKLMCQYAIVSFAENVKLNDFIEARTNNDFDTLL